MRAKAEKRHWYTHISFFKRLDWNSFQHITKKHVITAYWITRKLLCYISHQIFHYTRCLNIRVIAPAGNTAPFEETSQRWRAIGNTVSDLTGPRFELQTSPSRDERVTSRPTGRSTFDFQNPRMTQIILLKHSFFSLSFRFFLVHNLKLLLY